MRDGSPLAAGRVETVSALSHALEEAGVHLVVGPAGSGKTTVASAAAGRTGRTLWAGGGLPALADRPGTALARAVRIPVPPVLEDAVTVTVALTRDGILFLDDVHWADPHSLRVAMAAAARIRTLLCSTGGGRPRNGDPEVLDAVRAAAGTLVELGPLCDEDVASIVRAADPGAPEAEVARAVAAARGNPAAAVAAISGDSAAARRSLAVRARDLTVAGRTALVVLGLRGRPTPASRLGPGAPELVEHGLVQRSGSAVDPLLAFPSAGTYAVAGSLASAAALVELHRYLAAVSSDPWDRVRHLAAAGSPDRAVDEARRAAPSLAVGERARLLARAAELAPEQQARQLWRTVADAAEAAGDRDLAADARRRAVTDRLTEREAEVMTLVAAGMTTAAVARRLQVSAATVETHVQSAVTKLGCRTRTEAAVLFTTAGPR